MSHIFREHKEKSNNFSLEMRSLVHNILCMILLAVDFSITLFQSLYKLLSFDSSSLLRISIKCFIICVSYLFSKIFNPLISILDFSPC